jgi:hypothetical protein
VINHVRCAIVYAPIFSVIVVVIVTVRSRGGDLADRPQPVQRAEIAYEWQQLGQDVDQPCAVIANMEVRSDMALDLRVAIASKANWLCRSCLMVPTSATGLTWS